MAKFKSANSLPRQQTWPLFDDSPSGKKEDTYAHEKVTRHGQDVRPPSAFSFVPVSSFDLWAKQTQNAASHGKNHRE